MQINNLTTNTGNDIYYTDNYVLTVLYSIPYFIKNNLIRYTGIPDAIADKYEGDFYGLLDYLKVPKKLHRVYLSINNLPASTDYNISITPITLFDFTGLDMIANIMRSVEK